MHMHARHDVSRRHGGTQYKMEPHQGNPGGKTEECKYKASTALLDARRGRHPLSRVKAIIPLPLARVGLSPAHGG